MPSPQIEEPNRRQRFGFGALAIGSLFVIFAAAALLWTTLTTASAGFSGSTSNEGSFFDAGMVDLVLGADSSGATTTFLIDADGLYPGMVIDRCVLVTYRGGIDDVQVRLSGTLDDGTGLDRHLRTEIELGRGTSATCDDFRRASTAYSGTLFDLAGDHGSFADGIDLLSAADDGDAVAVRITVEVESDNRAQGLTTAFWLALEVRP